MQCSTGFYSDTIADAGHLTRLRAIGAFGRLGREAEHCILFGVCIEGKDIAPRDPACGIDDDCLQRLSVRAWKEQFHRAGLTEIAKRRSAPRGFGRNHRRANGARLHGCSAWRVYGRFNEDRNGSARRNSGQFLINTETGESHRLGSF